MWAILKIGEIAGERRKRSLRSLEIAVQQVNLILNTMIDFVLFFLIPNYLISYIFCSSSSSPIRWLIVFKTPTLWPTN